MKHKQSAYLSNDHSKNSLPQTAILETLSAYLAVDNPTFIPDSDSMLSQLLIIAQASTLFATIHLAQILNAS